MVKTSPLSVLQKIPAALAGSLRSDLNHLVVYFKKNREKQKLYIDTADPSGHARARASTSFLAFRRRRTPGLMHRSRLSMLILVERSVCFCATSSVQLSSVCCGRSTIRILNGDKELLDSHRRGKQRYRGQEGARHSDIHQEAAER